MTCTGFILAGGRSTRMGRDKALLDWHGQTLLEHMTFLLRDVTEDVQIVGREELPDRLPGLGPLSGIATALEVTATEANLVIAVDLPYLTKDFLKHLRNLLETSQYPLVACQIGTTYPLCLGMRRSLLPEVQRRLSIQQRSVRGLIDSGIGHLISESDLHRNGFGFSQFRNINTPEDYGLRA
jgi:molybdopterin-guanine dinucleotide biosynthesis protein A